MSSAQYGKKPQDHEGMEMPAFVAGTVGTSPDPLSPEHPRGQQGPDFT